MGTSSFFLFFKKKILRAGLFICCTKTIVTRIRNKNHVSWRMEAVYKEHSANAFQTLAMEIIHIPNFPVATVTYSQTSLYR